MISLIGEFLDYTALVRLARSSMGLQANLRGARCGSASGCAVHTNIHPGARRWARKLATGEAC